MLRIGYLVKAGASFVICVIGIKLCFDAILYDIPGNIVLGYTLGMIGAGLFVWTESRRAYEGITKPVDIEKK